MEILEGVIRLGQRPWRITPSSISIILHNILSLILKLLNINLQRALSIQWTNSFKNLETAADGTEISKKNTRNCCEMRTTQSKIYEIPEGKLNGKKTSRKKFPKIWVYLARFSSLWKFWKILFHSLLEVAEIQTGLFGWMESTQILLCCFHAHLIHNYTCRREAGS